MTYAPVNDVAGRVDELRRVIDDLDDQIIATLIRRIEVSREIQATRMSAGLPRIQYARENRVIERYTDAVGPAGTDLALEILRASRGDPARQGIEGVAPLQR